MIAAIGGGFALLSAAAARAGGQGSAAIPPEVADLPLTEIAATGPIAPVFAVFITGDGGWANIDKDITADLAAHGVSVVGLDSRRYLHNRREPKQIADDVGRIVRAYQLKWHQERFVLAGYSRGADLSPFIVTRMDTTLRRQLSLVAMVGLGRRAGFEFHFQDIFRDVKRAGDLPTLPELQQLGGVPMLCIYGLEEEESGCRDAPDSLVHRVGRPGSHHFDGNYRAVGDLILADLRHLAPPLLDLMPVGS